MTPIINANIGSPEEFYTQKHGTARNTVERTIGLLKARWRCLLRHRVLHYDPQTASKIINACCVLHNICNLNSLDSPSPIADVEEAINIEQNELALQPLSSSRSDELRRGNAARQTLISTLWQSRH